MAEDVMPLVWLLLFLAAVGWGALFASNTSLLIDESRITKEHDTYLLCKYWTGTSTHTQEYWIGRTPACPRWHSLATR